MSAPNTRSFGLTYTKTVASTSYEPGDMLYDNGAGAILPASSQADQLSEALNQEMFAGNFVGICNGKKPSSDTGTDELPVITGDGGEVRSACASTTWAVGDLVGAVEAASGTALEKQKVAKVADPALAIGRCTQAGASLTLVWWKPLPRSQNGTLQTVRKRFTVAQVNAGATLLPIRFGYKYRLVECLAISVGGAASAVTTVDVLATLTSSRKLVAYAQASLTQSAVLKAGGAGAAVLADGASYTANDVNTPVTVGKTGSDVATATHVDIIMSYVAERA